MEKDKDQLLEEQHLQSCLDIIRENIRVYEEKEKIYRKEVTELFQAVKKGEGDSYGQLTAEQNLLEHVENALRKNRASIGKSILWKSGLSGSDFWWKRKQIYWKTRSDP